MCVHICIQAHFDYERAHIYVYRVETIEMANTPFFTIIEIYIYIYIFITDTV
jgi:hypothetical protein